MGPAGLHLLAATAVSGMCPPSATDQPRRAVVHIGPPKTGTTHTQTWISGNAARLMGHGWAWPRANATGDRFLDGKGANFLPNALCGTVSKYVSTAFGKTQKWVPDERGSQEIVDGFSALLKRAGSEARNILFSNERFGVSSYCAEGKEKLRSMLAEAGAEKATVVLMFRTPLVAWARSGYNQQHEARAHIAKSLANPRLFSDEVTYLLRFLTLGMAQVFRDWRAAGFEVEVVSLAGAKQAGLDETDVLACEVLGIDCSNSNGTWPHPAVKEDSNDRPDTPDAVGAVSAAWKYYQDSHPKCLNASVSVDTIVQLSTKLASVIPEDSPLYNCTDYAALEASAREKTEAMLAGECVHRHVPPPATPPSLRYCEMKPERLAAGPNTMEEFARVCAGTWKPARR